MSCSIIGRVTDSGGTINGPIVNAPVSLYLEPPYGTTVGTLTPLQLTTTDEKGKFEFHGLTEGHTYYPQCIAFGLPSSPSTGVTVTRDEKTVANLSIAVGVSVSLKAYTGTTDEMQPCSHPIAGKRFCINASAAKVQGVQHFEFFASPDGAVYQMPNQPDAEVIYAESGPKRFGVKAFDPTVPGTVSGIGGAGGGTAAPPSGGGSPNTTYVNATVDTYASEGDRQMIGGHVGVRLERTRVHPTRDQALWVAIRNRTYAISFGRYNNFINRVLQAEERERLDDPKLERKLKELGTNLHGVGAYEVLKVATEAFLLLECGIRIEEDRDPNRQFYNKDFESGRVGDNMGFDVARAKLHEYLGSPPQLPYITRVIEAAFPEYRLGVTSNDRVLTGGINEPCLIELIWSYWHEEGMLAQTMNAVTRRFQNVRAPGERDPLAHLEIDPLRPLNNIVWGVIQDEIRRLSVKRRAYEYEHQYGLSLYGKAVGGLRPADSRSKFLEGFHNLLHLASVFFKEDNDTTVIADGYPLLNALKEVNLLLAQGAHNQFGDLPWTARSEMMLQQWMLARPEIRDFLQSRAMVPYKEAWMPQVDTMKSLQGWTDVTVTHFRDLGVYGEQILLAVRYGDWIAINDEDSAKNWARYWRPEIQGYLHAYRAATGVDLTNADTVDSTVPAILLQRRLVSQLQRTR
jgi:hypothetical protein